MIERHLKSVISDPTWGRQMRFVVGPRQSGKTTLMKSILTLSHSPHLYYNWDKPEIRHRYREDADFLSADLPILKKRAVYPWAGFDEIHKFPKWKDVLKGIFDTHEPQLRLMVSGSARLDFLKRAGDSLLGRYFRFRLFPFSLSEVSQRRTKQKKTLKKNALDLIEDKLSTSHFDQSTFEHLLRTSGFPEPFLNSAESFQRHWHQDYFDQLIRGDLRDLTRIERLENALYLIPLIGKGIGSPLSINSLRETLEDSYNAVRNYLRGLLLTYAIFEVKPYSKKISRGLKKLSKVYLFDWTAVKNEAGRFENFVACELNTWVHMWHDQGRGDFDLFFVRRRDGRETDFLVVRDKVPWFLVECKLKDQAIDGHHFDHAKQLGNIPIVQVVKEKGIARKGPQNSFRVSASRFFL